MTDTTTALHSEAGDLSAAEVASALQLAGLDPRGGLDGIPAGSVQTVRLGLAAMRAARPSSRRADEPPADEPAAPAGPPQCSAPAFRELRRAAFGLEPATVALALRSAGVGPAGGLEAVRDEQAHAVMAGLVVAARSVAEPPSPAELFDRGPVDGWSLADFAA
jgi:hypothetical protein